MKKGNNAILNKLLKGKEIKPDQTTSKFYYANIN